MDKDKELEYVRICLKDIRDKYKDSEDPTFNNLSVVMDLFILSTYMPHRLHDLYAILDKHLGDITGGRN